MLPTRMQVLEKLIKDNKYTKIAEIGVKKGDIAIYLLDNIKEIEKYYLVDPDDSVLDRYNILERHKSRSEFLKMTSVEASKIIPDGIDLVFIDADHSYESVKEDINAWIGKIRKGGIISGHDFSREHKECIGVVKAIDEVFGNNINLELEIEPDGYKINVWWRYT